MGKGNSLSGYEKGKIDQLISLKWSQRKISLEIGRSRNAIQNYLRSKLVPRSKSKAGRKKLIGPKTAKRLIKLASNKNISCKKLKEAIGFKGSEKTILRALHDSEILKFAKLRGKPVLTIDHKKNRFDFALKYINWEEQWNFMIFSDEKKFNLDGPDGFHYYWHNTQTEPLSCSKRVLGGGGVMIWVGFCLNGRTAIHFVETTMNSEKYTSMLNRALIPFAAEV
ncbi:hypothetical protein ENBRE01_0794 [Enteropsectra breve]|nr:hypothetical protein ENBRE01_0794 [Enteropsectra breve]